jgi:hypothetical protein
MHPFVSDILYEKHTASTHKILNPISKIENIRCKDQQDKPWHNLKKISFITKEQMVNDAMLLKQKGVWTIKIYEI